MSQINLFPLHVSVEPSSRIQFWSSADS